MKCECCNYRTATIPQKRDYIRYVCHKCSGLSDKDFFKKMEKTKTKIERRGKCGAISVERASTPKIEPLY